jgi:hypothetical protein
LGFLYTIDEQLQTLANGDLHSPLGRQNEGPPLVGIDHSLRCIVVQLYSGLLKVIPMDPTTGALSDAFDIR